MISAVTERQDQTSRPAPIDVFTLRCEARAMLVAYGLMTISDATDALQNAAANCGLIETLGTDTIQVIMAKAIDQVRRF